MENRCKQPIELLLTFAVDAMTKHEKKTRIQID